MTTIYAVRHPLRTTRVGVVHFPEPEHLDAWCVANGIGEAVVGGFFLRDPYRPLGELWIDGPLHLLNRPYSSQDQPAPASRRFEAATATAAPAPAWRPPA